MGDYMDFNHTIKKISKRCTGDERVVYTPIYKFEYPHSHRVKGGLRTGYGQITGTLRLCPDFDDKHLVWPAKLEFKLLAYMNGDTKVLGTREMVWDVTNGKDDFEDISRRNSITVSLQDLKTKYNMIGAADDSVTFYWSVKLSYPQPQDLQSAASSSEIASQEDTGDKMKTKTQPDLASHQDHSSDSELRADGVTEEEAQIHDEAHSEAGKRFENEEACEYDFLLVGKPGAGKSALGNSILQKQVFGKKHSLESGGIQKGYSVFEKAQLKVVEIPGFLGQSQNEEKLSNFKEGSMQHAVNIINDIIEADPGEFHVVLYVVRYGPELTKEESDMVEHIRSRFGESFFQEYCILVMTCGDFFKKSDGTFAQWCNKQKEQSGGLGKLISEVEDRVVLFDNRTDHEKKLLQVKRIVHMARDLKKKKAQFTASGATSEKL